MSIDRRIGVRIDFSANGPMKGQVEQMKSGVDQLGESVAKAQGKWGDRELKRMGVTLSDMYKTGSGAFGKAFGLGNTENSTKFTLDEPVAQAQQIVRTLRDGFRMLELPENVKGVPLSPRQQGDRFKMMEELPLAQMAPSKELEAADKLHEGFRRQFETTGMSQNRQKVWDLKQNLDLNLTSAQIKELNRHADQADAALEADAQKRADKQRKGIFSGKRMFAGAGFGLMTLTAGELFKNAPEVGSLIGAASGGAGAGTMMGMSGHGVAGMAATSTALSLLGTTFETILPTTAQLNVHFGALAEKMKSADEVIMSLSRGDSPGEAAIASLPGLTSARIRAAGGEFGAPGTAEARMEAARGELDRLRAERTGAVAPSGLTSTFIRGVGGSERAETSFTTGARGFDAAIRTLEAGLRDRSLPGLFEPAAVGAVGSGETESISDILLGSAAEHSPVVAAVDRVTDEVRRTMGPIAAWAIRVGAPGASP